MRAFGESCFSSPGSLSLAVSDGCAMLAARRAESKQFINVTTFRRAPGAQQSALMEEAGRVGRL